MHQSTLYGIEPAVKKGPRTPELADQERYTKLHAINDTSGRPLRLFVTGCTSRKKTFKYEKRRNSSERMFDKFKDWRRVVTR